MGRTVAEQQLALSRAAELIASAQSGEALALLSTVSHKKLAARVRFLTAHAVVVARRVDALAVLAAVVTEWLGPPVVGGMNQSVTREELLGLIDRFDPVPEPLASLRQRVESSS